MPELPEVETMLQGIQPVVVQQQIARVVVYQPQLRWRISAELPLKLIDQRVDKLSRRGKYLLLHLSCQQTVILHFGMSGYLRITSNGDPLAKHDHVEFVFENDISLRFNDARRFGALLWTDEDPYQHSLLKNLGLEPLSEDFSDQYLYHLSRDKKISIKQFIMNHHVVVGIGNIYATEALFSAGIHPLRQAKDITLQQYKALVKQIKRTLQHAIQLGGTTVKDFQNTAGKPGYFKQRLKAYGRAGLKCTRCEHTLEKIRLGQRVSVFCSGCQT